MIITEINVYAGENVDYTNSNYDFELEELVLVSSNNTVSKYYDVRVEDHVAFKANPTASAVASIFQNHDVAQLNTEDNTFTRPASTTDGE